MNCMADSNFWYLIYLMNLFYLMKGSEIHVSKLTITALANMYNNLCTGEHLSKYYNNAHVSKYYNNAVPAKATGKAMSMPELDSGF